MPTRSKSTSVPPNEDAIRQRAYLLWEADGRPDGMAEHYWLKAMEVPPAANKPKAAKASAPAAKAKPKAAVAAKAVAPVVKAKATKAAPAKKAAKKA